MHFLTLPHLCIVSYRPPIMVSKTCSINEFLVLHIIGIRLVGLNRVGRAGHRTSDRRGGVRDRGNRVDSETRYPRLAEERPCENHETRRELYSQRRHTLGEEQTGFDEKIHNRDADDDHHHHHPWGNRLFQWLRADNLGRKSGRTCRRRVRGRRPRRRRHDIGRLLCDGNRER